MKSVGLTRRDAIAATAVYFIASQRYALADPACPGKELGHVPLVNVGGQWLVPVRFGSEPVSMVFDTGATVPAMSAAGAEQLHLTKIARGASETVGGIAEVKLVEVPAFNFAGIALHGLMMPVQNMRLPQFDVLPPVGLLGLSLLWATDLDIDFKGEQLALYPPSDCSALTPPWKGSFTRLPMQVVPAPTDIRSRTTDVLTSGNNALTGPGRAVPGELRVDIQINGQVLRARVDTGASGMLVSQAAAERVGLKSEGDTTGGDAAGNTLRYQRSHVAELRLGDLVFRDVPIRFGAGRIGYGCDALLGQDILRQCRVWIAFKSGQMLLQRNA